MKRRILVLILTITWMMTYSQNCWVQKANFGGGKRLYAVGFSIGTNGYIVTGKNNSNYYVSDFWEYNSITNSWTQKASFPGNPRISAVGFSIGNKGYVGTGEGEGLYEYFNDFWEYDPSTNTWDQITDFPGTERSDAVGFSIGNKGYVGTGRFNDYGTPIEFDDFWEYDPTSNSWSQKADFGGGYRSSAVGFAINNKGYVGTGGVDDFWEYNPSTDSWIRKADLNAPLRGSAVGFAIGNYGYVCTGSYLGQYFADVNKYNPNTNVWVNNWQENFTGGTRTWAVGFAIGSNGYFGTGYSNSSPYYFYDFWKFTPISLGIEESSITIARPSFHPNPVIIQTTLKLLSDVKNCVLKIYDLQGNEIMKTIFSGNQISIQREDQPGGIYIYALLQEGKIFDTGRLIFE